MIIVTVNTKLLLWGRPDGQTKTSDYTSDDTSDYTSDYTSDDTGGISFLPVTVNLQQQIYWAKKEC